MTNGTKVVIVSIAPYRFATRAKKAAHSYSEYAEVHYVSLAAAGRTGRWDVPGELVVDGIHVKQVPVAPIDVRSNRSAQLRNLTRSYIPGLFRLLRSALAIDADVIHVVDPSLTIIGHMHQKKYQSVFILDLPERPGQIEASQSLASRISRLEPKMLSFATRRAHLATVAVPTDVAIVQKYGFREVLPVRNVPLLSWRAEFVEPRSRPINTLETVLIGSVFEGRGYEMALRAIARSKDLGVTIALRIFGPGRPDYLASLQRLTSELQIDGQVVWQGNIASDKVSEAYCGADVGLVLYEGDDPGNDGLSNKILECVATGRPVLAGDLPENRRFVSESHVGWLSEMNVESLATRLTEIARTSNLATLSRHCREVGDTQLVWEQEFAPVLQRSGVQ